MKKRIAIVGTGISAMTCAHYLRNDYEITLFEKNDYVGGHTHTHKVEGGMSVDTGFIVFNRETYKNMLNMFDDLGVVKQESDMAFSVYNLKTGLMYSTASLSKMFAQTKNLFSVRFWKFIFEIPKFFKIALKDYKEVGKINEALRDYCRKRGLSDYFVDNYLGPMSSAVWSTSYDKVYDLPMGLLIPFFFNHGMLSVSGQYQWYTVKGGSNTYTNKIAKGLDIRLSEEVLSAEEKKGYVALNTKKDSYKFDYVILASHADESLKIAKSLPEKKKALLKPYSYSKNKVVLHTDSSIMPPVRNVWASWNQITDGINTSTVYWMNKLQRLDTKKDYFVSLNPFQKISKDKIIKEIDYYHPLYTIENYAIQERLQDLNKDTRIFFAGSYFGYGFHEDGCKAGLKVVECFK